ncbi:RND superfamily putative drug exporter [Herbihabitans rhizosphaerae]|uniref:RND superfamily putative drug exporter n=1 Tax=Herbihabitans rhizosphaerae TaxID=1872711 RepID=A0A4V2ER88_9PSEU|nr:MMPL family transporter [Herbihabitans rhizosphaerae]RZS29601.1 RND superfamily putative drug exporter [Herbihabitans rhizosphaerae]
MAGKGNRRAWFASPVGRVASWITAGIWVIMLVLAAPFAADMGSVQSDKQTDRLPAAAESTRLHELAERIPGDESDQVLVVYHRDGGLTEADMTVAHRHRDALAVHYGQTMPPVRSDDRSTAMFAVQRVAEHEDEKATSAFVEHVRQVTTDRPSGLTTQVTGPSALSADIDAVFEGIDVTLMLVTTAVVALLLIITYRSPFLWLVPLLSVGAAAFLSMAAVYLLASAADITVSTQSFSIMVVLVFGAGTDYALLLVARYREELRRDAEPREAMRAALRGVGPAILASGGTVALGLLCLLAAAMNDISGIGLIGAVGIACTLATMLTLFPVLLVSLRRKVFWPRVPVFGEPVPTNSRMARLAARLTARPVRTAGVTAVVLGALTLGTLGLSTSLGQADQFVSKPESVSGFETLATAFPDQGGRPLRVAVPSQHAAATEAAIRALPGISDVRPDRAGNGWTLLDATPKAAPDSQRETDTVAALRAETHRVGGPDALVGGDGAERVDTENATAADMRLVIPLVLVVVLLVLMVLLRAVTASVVTVAAVVLSFGAALGIGSVLFDTVFTFGGSEPSLALMCFVFLVAVGVDYAIFLVARISDDAPTLGTTVATRRALTATAGVIASAGVVLAATFAVLAAMPFVPIVQIGVVVAIGVLLQTLIVQPALMAPLVVALRKVIWWPGRRQTRTIAPEPVSTVDAGR